MKKLFVLILVMFFIQLSNAQEKPRASVSNETARDSTLSLSIEKFDARVQELQGELEKQVKTKGQAQKVLQQTEDNIKALQSAIQAMLMVKQDTTLHVQSEKKITTQIRN